MRIPPFAAIIVLLSACTSVSEQAPTGGVTSLTGPLPPSLEIRSSRSFSGPTQFPPAGFAGYGVLAFPSRPDQDPERFQLFCNAFLSSLPSSERLKESGVPASAQMVTVLPVSSSDLAFELSSFAGGRACSVALREYGLIQAQDAINKAEAAAERTDGIRELDGRGPFLIAWSPGRTFGSKEALVLVADLSNSSTPEQIQSDMRTWRRDIEEDPRNWRTGWNTEGVRLVAQRWVDRRGGTIIKLFGEWGVEL